MADNADEKLDVLFGELSARSPFPVDWEQYERELMQRIWQRQAERRRRTAWVGVASAITGAVATFVATVTWMTPSAPELPVTTPKQQNAVVPVSVPRQHNTVIDEQPDLRVVRHEDGRLDISGASAGVAANKEIIPFSKRGSSNGRQYQISFSGFTPEGAERPSVIMPIPAAE